MSFLGTFNKLFRLIFLLVFLAVPTAIYFAVQDPPGMPSAPGDADQQAENFEQKIIFLERQWEQKETTEVGISAAEINAAYARERGDTMRVAFIGNQTELFLVQRIAMLTIYIQAIGKTGVSQRRITFTPTDLKIGKIPVPLTMANSLIQEKLHDPAMQEQLRLPAFISTVKIKDSQLVLGTSPKGR